MQQRPYRVGDGDDQQKAGKPCAEMPLEVDIREAETKAFVHSRSYSSRLLILSTSQSLSVILLPQGVFLLGCFQRFLLNVGGDDSRLVRAAVEEVVIADRGFDEPRERPPLGR